MRKRFLAWVGILLAATLAVVLVVPGSRTLTLGYLKREPTIDNLPESYYVQAMRSPKWETRRDAVFALGTLGKDGRGAVAALAAALHDDEPRVRFNAALALFKIGPDGGAAAAVGDLSEALDDDVPLVRMDAAMALCRIGPGARAAVPALIQALRRRDNRVLAPGMPFGYTIREQAALALGRIGPGARDAVPDLREALSDEEPNMRGSAAAALRLIDPTALGE
jgi:HEAT repeat protein